tara:strand:- start:7113 stop:8147 length:1035 start_codon:yes stop_codon:yes gene_type:complete
MKILTAFALGMSVAVGSMTGVSAAEPVVIKAAWSAEGDMRFPGSGQTACMSAMKNYIEVASEGRFEFDMYPGGALGNPRTMIETAQTGAIQIVGAYTAIMVPFAPEISITQIPYIFRDNMTAWKVMSGPVGDELADIFLKKTGLRVLAWPDGAGFRNIYTEKPVKSVADLKGMNMRVPENPGLLAMFRGWGANTVTISWSELYTSLQAGMAEGHDTELYSMYSKKLYEVNPHVAVTRHSFNLHPVMINEEFFQSLSPDDQTMILQAGDLCGRVGNSTSYLSGLVVKSVMEAEGATFYYPTEAQIEEFRALGQQPYIDMISRKIGDDSQQWIDKILAAAKAAEKE